MKPRPPGCLIPLVRWGHWPGACLQSLATLWELAGGCSMDRARLISQLWSTPLRLWSLLSPAPQVWNFVRVRFGVPILLNHARCLGGLLSHLPGNSPPDVFPGASVNTVSHSAILQGTFCLKGIPVCCKKYKVIKQAHAWSIVLMYSFPGAPETTNQWTTKWTTL